MARVPREVSRERERQAWELRQQFWTERMIADRLGVTESAVCLMLQRVERRFFEEMNGKVEEQKARQTSQLEQVAKEAWVAWERSKLDAESTETTEEETELKGLDGSTIPATNRKTKTTRKGQSGDPRHLDNTMKALEDIRDIWGIEAPKKADVTTLGRPMFSGAVVVRPNERCDDSGGSPEGNPTDDPAPVQ